MLFLAEEQGCGVSPAAHGPPGCPLPSPALPTHQLLRRPQGRPSAKHGLDGVGQGAEASPGCCPHRADLLADQSTNKRKPGRPASQPSVVSTGHGPADARSALSLPCQLQSPCPGDGRQCSEIGGTRGTQGEGRQREMGRKTTGLPGSALTGRSHPGLLHTSHKPPSGAMKVPGSLGGWHVRSARNPQLGSTTDALQNNTALPRRLPRKPARVTAD